MTICVFVSHFGLGDAIMFFGCVRYLSTKYARVWVICKEKNLPEVRAIYRDLPTVDAVPFGVPERLLPSAIDSLIASTEENVKVYFNGKWAHKGRLIDGFRFPDSLYHDIPIPTTLRRDLFLLPIPINSGHPVSPNRPYIFVADQSTTTKIPLFEALVKMYPNIPVVSADRNDVYAPDHPFFQICDLVVRRKDTRICDYAEIIRGALEIHCIDSALWCLADTLDPLTPRRKTVFIRWDVVQSSPSFDRFVCGEHSTLTRDDILFLLSMRRVCPPRNLIKM